MKDVSEFLYRSYMLNPDSTVRRLVRFCSVGASGTAVNLAAIAVLIDLLSVRPLAADALAIEISIISNFIMNHNYTFRFSKHKDDHSRLIHKLVKFNIGALGGALLSFAVFSFLYKYTGMYYLLADLVGIILATGWNYWVSTRFVWKSVDAGV